MLILPLRSDRFPVRCLALMNDCTGNDLERRDRALNLLNDIDGDIARNTYIDCLCDPAPAIVRATFESLLTQLDQADATAQHVAGLPAATAAARKERDELKQRDGTARGKWSHFDELMRK